MVNTVITKGFKTTCFAAAAFTAFATFRANADIVISGTRIVYPASSKDVIVNPITGAINLYWCKPGWMTGVTVLIRRS